MKQCSRCGECKPLSGFYKHKKSRGGIMAMCRKCVGARQRAYEAKNIDEVRAKVRAYNLKNRDKLLAQQKEYKEKNREKIADKRRETETGFSPELFKATIALQNGKCGICKCDLSALQKKHVHADHCHDTMQPRGVLCRQCNVALGQVGDNIENVLRVLEYLQNPPAYLVKML